jgi:uroporphyrin-III C-methyltransferase
MNTPETKTGWVVLAGAGPGDPELITIKLQKRLGEADVVLSDRLVHPQIVHDHASPHAEVILTGKQGYNSSSYTQDEVTALIIAKAKEGKKVVRLKGGDVAFFSNVLDELQLLRENHISYEIIPGVTAASGASAYLGMPLTARGYAQGVRFITFNPNSIITDTEWKSIAASTDTLICYMASRNLAALAEKLIASGANESLPLAVVEQATTRFQKLFVTTLRACKQDIEGKQFKSPSLVIIGEVVKLHELFSWFSGEESTGSDFPELEGS